MQRLVQLSDLEKYPQLASQGISVNMYYDFGDLEESSNEVPTEVRTEAAAVEKEEQIKDTPKPIKQKAATKPTQRKTAPKQKAKSK